MAVQISTEDERYRESAYQEFRTFEEAERLLGNYCNQCRLESTCKITKGLMHAIGNNYPFFSKEFVKLELKAYFRPRLNCLSELEERLPETLVVCKEFKSKQLKFAFTQD